MKQRILLFVAVLLIATPAFAAVTVNVTQGLSADVNKVTVAYTATGGDKVRAFALDLTIEANSPQTNWAGIHDFNVGESNKPGGGYGIFPGQFRNQIDPANPNWGAQYYYPVAPTGDVDSNGTGIGQRKVICELGTLYKDSNEPGAAGKLFVLDVNFNGNTTPQGLTVVANAVRGGVILENGSAPSLTINAPLTLIPPPPAGCVCPNVVTKTTADANAAITAAGFTNPPSISWVSNCTVKDGNVISQTQTAGQTYPCDTVIQYVFSHPCKGDSNADGKVNNSDIVSISTNLGLHGTGSPKRIPNTSQYYDFCSDADVDTFIKNSDIVKISTWIGLYGTGSPKRVNCPHNYN